MTQGDDVAQLFAEVAAIDALLRAMPADDYVGRMGLEERRKKLLAELYAAGLRDGQRDKVQKRGT
jgi:hypothetical protein